MNVSTLLRSVFFSLLFVFALSGQNSIAASKPRVLVWDERQPAQKQVYTNFLGNEIAGFLRKSGDFEVKSAGLDDSGQGLNDLDRVDVLIWWGHQRHGEISAEKAKDIVRRIKEGRLSLIALHSAHWSQPFVEAMRERSRIDALTALAPAERGSAVLTETNLFANFRSQPKYDSLRTPAAIYRKPINGPIQINLTLPNCAFPAVRADGKPSEIVVLQPKHPIMRGLPAKFQVDQTEMYDEPFHIPAPDVVVLEERWASGDWFRSGAVWNLGQGKVFYFRPGHETYAVFKNPNVQKLIENAVRWMGSPKK